MCGILAPDTVRGMKKNKKTVSRQYPSYNVRENPGVLSTTKLMNTNGPATVTISTDSRPDDRANGFQELDHVLSEIEALLPVPSEPGTLQSRAREILDRLKRSGVSGWKECHAEANTQLASISDANPLGDSALLVDKIRRLGEWVNWFRRREERRVCWGRILSSQDTPSLENFYGVVFKNNGKGFAARSNYDRGNLSFRAVESLTNGNRWDYSGDTLKALFNAVWASAPSAQILEFETAERLFSWLSV